ncbi:MAG: TolC family outer membrane protein [Pseudomonadota bacterium]
MQKIIPAVFAMLILQAAPAAAQSLEESIEAAVNANPRLAAERAQADAIEANVDSARSAIRPQLAIDGSYQRQDVSRTSAFNQITGTQDTSDFELDTLNVGIEATQTLFQGFQNRNRIAQAGASADAARADLNGVRQSVIVGAVAAHANVLRDEAAFELRQSSVSTLESQVEGAERRRELNDATVTDLAQARARLAGARAEMALARADVLASRANYENIVGQPAGTLGALPALSGTPESFASAYEIALESAPALTAARSRASASEDAVSVARADYAPSVSAFARAGYAEDTNFVGDSRDDISVGLRLRVPLYQGGAVSAAVRGAKSVATRDRFLVDQAERDVRAIVDSQWQALLASRLAIEAIEEQVVASQLAFESMQEEALGGVRTLTDVLDAERDMLAARVSLAEARRDAYVAEWALLESIGLADPSLISVQ